MKKKVFTVLAILSITLLTTSVSYAQWGGILGGILQAVGERYIENSNYSNKDKDNMKTVLDYISNEVNTNQNAKNTTKEAYEGNYTGAIIQGAQTIMNAAGNYDYNTYLNSANQINNANREYQQDINNGMDKEAALEKRNTTIGNASAESIIEIEDRIARKKAEEARRQREKEQQSREGSSRNTASSYNEIETNKQTFHDYAVGNNENVGVRNLNEYNSYNSKAQILSNGDFIKFLTSEGNPIYLIVSNRSLLFYNNLYCDREIRLDCNRVSIKVKYAGESIVQSITDACSFVLPAKSYGELELSDVFVNLSDEKTIESIKVQFVDTQIK